LVAANVVGDKEDSSGLVPRQIEDDAFGFVGVEDFAEELFLGDEGVIAGEAVHFDEEGFAD